MKRLACFLLVVAVMAAGVFALAAGFSDNPDSIEEAAKSVLLLEIYDKKNKLIATGSGFVALDKTSLVTNYHVIEDAAKIIAYDDDNRTYTISRVKCADERLDIAILDFNTNSSIPPLAIKVDKQLKRGAPVVAIGSPKSYKNIVSKGIISSYDSVDEIIYLITFTASTTHGSSGGALLNDSGEVIGITSGTLDDEAESLNYAISISLVKAMYSAWGGSSYALTVNKREADFDFDNIYDDVASQDGRDTVSLSSSDFWTCPECGNKNTARFCSECGTEKPLWQCMCGQINSGKFCVVCGESLQKMIGALDTALVEIENTRYENAISNLKSLKSFNCMSIASYAGKNISASEQVLRACYLLADEKLKIKDFASAYEYFENAGTYSDAEQRVYEVFYKQGKYQISISKYDEAIESFIAASIIYDVTDDIASCHFLKAKHFERSNQFDEAIAEYQKAGSYMNAPACVAQTYYEKAEYLLAQKDYDGAVLAFSAAGNYLDAGDRVLSVYYVRGSMAENDGLLDIAIEWYTKAGAYSDATQRIDAIREQQQADINRVLAEKYSEAEELFKNGQYSQAIGAFKGAEDYQDAPERILQCYYLLGEKYRVQMYYETAETYYKQAGKYGDAEEKRTEMIYLQAKTLAVTNETKARSLLKTIFEYDKAVQLYNEITYSNAEKQYASGSYAAAMKYYQDCPDYLDSLEKLRSCNEAKVRDHLLKGQYTAAQQQVNSSAGEVWAIDDFLVLEPGNEGALVSKVLGWAKGMAFLDWYPTDETVYQDKYKYAIQRMEKNFGMEADGVITYREYVVLDSTIYPGCQGSDVKKLLEYISDLGYFDALGNLPDTHNTYEARYQYSIKRLETDLKLTADGFLTSAEITKIKKQPITAPAKVEKVTLTTSGGAVNVSWTSAKGAKWYVVYRNGSIVATITSTYYYDKDALQGEYNRYYIKSCKYNKNAQSVTKSIYVDPVYTWVSCYNLSTKYSNYANKYVTIESANVVYRKAENGDYYIVLKQVVNSKNYYVCVMLEDYTTWNWGTSNWRSKLTSLGYCGGKGKVIGKTTIGSYRNIPQVKLNQLNW